MAYESFGLSIGGAYIRLFTALYPRKVGVLIANNHHNEMTKLPGYPHMIHKQDPDRVVALIRHIYHDVVKSKAAE